MPETTPPPADLAALSLAQIVAAIDGQDVAPVDQWHPEHCGDSAMRIARDGTWYHEGRPIARPAMVRLFARILRREPNGGFVLVTPVEKLAIAVEDAPFVAIEMKSEGGGRARRIAFRLNTDEIVVAGPENGLRIAEAGDSATPYLHVRRGLEARIARPVYYEMVELALAEGEHPPGIWSDGTFLSLMPR